MRSSRFCNYVSAVDHPRPVGCLRLLVALAACLLLLHGSAHAGGLATDFNTGLPAGTSLYGSAYWSPTGGVNNSGMVVLTNNVSAQTGFLIVPDLDGGQPVRSLVVDFHALVGGGTVPPADGFSVNFANDLPIPSSSLPVEEGLGRGLSICFDSFNNGGPEAPAIEVRWNGSLVSRVFTPVSRSADTYFPYRIVLDPDGTVDVITSGPLGDIPIFSNLATGYTPISGGQFAFAARTGSLNDKHWIDNLSIQTTPFVRDQAHYSLEGWFANGSETQSFLLSFDPLISQAIGDPFSLRTWQYGGGTNAAGDVIVAGGFDPVLSLYKLHEFGETLVATNDDIDTGGGLWDSQITWGALTELPAGDYRLDLTAYGGALGGRQRRWAVDLVGPAPVAGSSLTLTALNRIGVTTVKSLKVGAEGVHDTYVNVQKGQALSVSGDLVLGPNSAMTVDGGTLSAGRIEVRPAGKLWIYDGTVSTSELVLEGGLLGSGAIILAEGGTLWNRGGVEPGSGLDLTSNFVLPNGDFIQVSSGRLFMNVGGTSLADYDRLVLLEGDATLAGSLYLSLVGGFVPLAGDSFKLVTAAAGVNAAGLIYYLPDLTNHGREWFVSTTPTALVLTVENMPGRQEGRGAAVAEPATLWLAAVAGLLLGRRGSRRSKWIGTTAGPAPGVMILLLIVTSPAAADEVYFSFEGWFADGSETQSFFFDVPYSSIAPPEPFSLRTWHASGGINAAGDAIASGGFDSRLWLYNNAQSLVATSDDGTGLGLDSQITWIMPNLPPYSIPPPNPLPAGKYRLDLTAFNGILNQRQSHWAVDLILPAGPVSLTGVGHSGVSTLKSLKLGTASASFVARAVIGSGQSLVMSDDLVVGESAVMTNAGLIAAGRVLVEDVGWLTLDNGTVSTGQLIVDFALEGTGDIVIRSAGGSLQNHGTVQPGHWWYTAEETLTGEGGAITVASGDYEQTSRLQIYIGGRSPTQHGQLHVLDGSASLGGELVVDLVEHGGSLFQPARGDTFEILTAAGGLGGTTFAIEALPPLAGGLYFDVLYSANAVTLAVLGILGDYNRNGVVDAADYTVWRNSLGATGSGLAADGTGPGGVPDGIVNQLDYQFWKAHFGATAGNGAGRTDSARVVASVPEPASLALAMIAAALLLARPEGAAKSSC